MLSKGVGWQLNLTIELGPRAQLSEGDGEVVAHNLEVGRSRQGPFICIHCLRQPALQQVNMTVAGARTPPRLPGLVLDAAVKNTAASRSCEAQW